MKQGHKGRCIDRKTIVILVVELVAHDLHVCGAVMQSAHDTPGIAVEY